MPGHDGMDHGDHQMGSEMDRIGHATGTVRSVGAQDDFVTISHGPFDGGKEARAHRVADTTAQAARTPAG